MTHIRVLVADDHTLVRQGLVSLLEDSGECVVVAQAGDGKEALTLAHETRPEIAIIDFSMPRLGGLEAVRRMHTELPDTHLLVLTMHGEEEYVLPIVRAGASGYLVKDAAASDLLNAIRALHAGHAYFGPQAARALAEQSRRPDDIADPYGNLTDREREVLHLVAEGKSTKQIARLLDIGVKTAENHRSRMMEKLGLHNAAEVVRYAARKKLLD